MKKILSLTLAALMVVSMIPTAFAADVDYTNGTQVEATGTRSTVEDDGSVTHNAEYTITVPAMLAPGGSGTVTLEGYWPSDATVKVTAEEKVEVVNNINSADKKELAVTFASIEKAGSNTAIVTASAPVSVADISAALFGTWSGKFNYNVEYNGEAGGSGTVTPTPDPEQPDDVTCTNHVDADGDGICDTEGCNETVSNSGESDGNYVATFADNSWEAIATACQNDEVPSTWAVGDTKTMTIGEATYNVTIIGTNHDTYADGGIAPLTFQADIVSLHAMNSTDTNAGGWAGSEMYSYLNTELINELEFASYIQPVVKSTNKGYADSGNTTATEAVDSNDKLFLLSAIEVLGTQRVESWISKEVYNLEGSQYAYYAAGNPTDKNYKSGLYAWWVRSPFAYDADGFSIVSSDYNISDRSATGECGVAFGFCF